MSKDKIVEILKKYLMKELGITKDAFWNIIAKDILEQLEPEGEGVSELFQPERIDELIRGSIWYFVDRDEGVTIRGEKAAADAICDYLKTIEFMTPQQPSEGEIKIDEESLRGLFVKHGAKRNKRFREGKLNCTELDTNSLIWEIARITESVLKDVTLPTVTEEEIEEILLFHYGKGKNKLSWRVRAAKTTAKAIKELLNR